MSCARSMVPVLKLIEFDVSRSSLNFNLSALFYAAILQPIVTNLTRLEDKFIKRSSKSEPLLSDKRKHAYRQWQEEVEAGILLADRRPDLLANELIVNQQLNLHD